MSLQPNTPLHCRSFYLALISASISTSHQLSPQIRLNDAESSATVGQQIHYSEALKRCNKTPSSEPLESVSDSVLIGLRTINQRRTNACCQHGPNASRITQWWLTLVFTGRLHASGRRWQLPDVEYRRWLSIPLSRRYSWLDQQARASNPRNHCAGFARCQGLKG